MSSRCSKNPVPTASKFYVSIVIVGVVKDDLSIHKRDMMQLVVLSVACLVIFIGKVSFTVLRDD